MAGRRVDDPRLSEIHEVAILPPYSRIGLSVFRGHSALQKIVYMVFDLIEAVAQVAIAARRRHLLVGGLA
jgi:hypothetical protein